MHINIDQERQKQLKKISKKVKEYIFQCIILPCINKKPKPNCQTLHDT